MCYYVVKSGAGYFLRFQGETPVMTTDVVVAKRMGKKVEALEVVAQLDGLGFAAELVEVRVIEMKGR